MKANEMTFGVEIEAYYPHGVTRSMIEIRLPPGWEVHGDGSLNSPPAGCPFGFEVVSPTATSLLLKGMDGFRQVRDVLAALASLGARVNQTCGLHVHVGWGTKRLERYTTAAGERLAMLVGLVANHQKGLYASTGTKSRERGPFARPIQGRYDGPVSYFRRMRFSPSHSNRYHLLNVVSEHPTVEFRLFAGTLNPIKAVAAVAMALELAEQSYECKRLVNWVQKTKAPPTGRNELERLLKRLGWTKKGYIPVGMTLDERDRAVTEMRRLADQYDQQE